MKRKLFDDESSPPQPNSKRAKNSETISIWNQLASDEVSSILWFLTVGETLMFSLTCKSLYNLVEQTVKMVQPHVLSSDWTLATALRTRLNLVIFSRDHVTKLHTFVTENKSLMSQSLVMVYSPNLNAEQRPLLIDLLPILSHEIHQIVPMNVSDIDVQTFESDFNYSRRLVKRLSKVNLTVGSQLTKLALKADGLSRNGILSILQNCPYLQTLDIIQSVPLFERRIEVNDTLQVSDQFLQIPVLEQLKSLIIESSYEGGHLLVLELLQLAPNLEEFHFTYLQVPDSKILEYVAVHCPLLKDIRIESDDDIHIRNKFTDADCIQLLERLPNLTSLAVNHSTCFSGELWAKIGKFNKLKNIEIAPDPETTVELKDVHFGGGVLDKMHTLYMLSAIDYRYSETFAESLVTTVPNVIDISLPDDIPNVHLVYEKYGDKLEHINLAEPTDETIAAISNNNRLFHLQIIFDSFYYESLSSIIKSAEYLQEKCKWDKLSKLELEIGLVREPVKWLEALAKAAPNLQNFQYSVPEVADITEFQKAMYTVLSNKENFKNLKLFQILECESGGGIQLEWSTFKNIMLERPLLVMHPSEDYKRSDYGLTADECFLREWLTLDNLNNLVTENSRHVARNVFT